MPEKEKLWRVKISKTVSQTIEVLAPDADKAVESAQNQCPFYERQEPYGDGFRDETSPSVASVPTETAGPTVGDPTDPKE
jgi:hypothetical protein